MHSGLPSDSRPAASALPGAAPASSPGPSPRQPVFGEGRERRILLSLFAVVIPTQAGLAALIYFVQRAAAPEDKLGASLLAFALPLYVLLPLSFLAFRRVTRRLRERLERSTVVAGEVTAVAESGVPGDSGSRATPTLRYRDGAGKLHEVAASHGTTTVARGDAVTVRYDPLEPTWAMVDEADPIAMRVVWTIMVGGAVSAVAMTAWGVTALGG